jgi:hypothetical protein
MEKNSLLIFKTMRLKQFKLSSIMLKSCGNLKYCILKRDTKKIKYLYTIYLISNLFLFNMRLTTDLNVVGSMFKDGTFK